MKEIYTWKYLESLISRYYITQESFIESFNEETGLNIAYIAFRQQKKRQTKKHLKHYINYILQVEGTPLERIGENFINIVEEIEQYQITNASFIFKNKGDFFELKKSWETTVSENYIKHEILIFIHQFFLTSFIKEVLANKLLINIIKAKITKYLNNKIDLIEDVIFDYNNNELCITVQFNKKKYVVVLPLQQFKSQIKEEIYDEIY